MIDKKQEEHDEVLKLLCACRYFKNEARQVP